MKCSRSVRLQKVTFMLLVYFYIRRWMLLSFKREFSWPDSLRLFEILSSHHLELSSMEAERIRERERRKDFESMGW